MRLEAPTYTQRLNERKIFLGAKCMETHTADAGWQLTLGFKTANYELWGKDFENDEIDVNTILEKTDPGIVVVQDKREWEGLTAGARGNSYYRFEGIELLKEREDIFKLTVLKDCHQQNAYHCNSAEEIGCHAWITYYHPNRVVHDAPFVRKEHLIRTYHTVDYCSVPPYRSSRNGCILSGAVSKHYPLRSLLVKKIKDLPGVTYKKHPGYHSKGCATPNFLKELSKYKVAICTSSKYKYALRKIIEATACGCIVITDLPHEDRLPYIDDNLVRISDKLSKEPVRRLLPKLYERYSPVVQKRYAELAKQHYDYRVMGVKLSQKIEEMRQNYGTGSTIPGKEFVTPIAEC